jgi:hypothetical protein
VVLDNLPKGFTAMSHSFSLTVLLEKYGYSKIQDLWSESHHFGAVSLDGRQLFRQYYHFNENTFYKFKQIHHKFPKSYLFLDKAPQHYKSHKVRKYFEEHKDSIIPLYLPIASPEFMVLERVLEYIQKRSVSTNIL